MTSAAEIIERLRAQLAALTALPPLPEGWIQRELPGEFGCPPLVVFRNATRPPSYGLHEVTASRRFVNVGETTGIVPADLITVLRHAEAAHQRLREGGER